MGDLAKIAYEAYATQQNWKNSAGKAIPDWDEVRANIKVAWAKAVEAVLAEIQS